MLLNIANDDGDAQPNGIKHAAAGVKARSWKKKRILAKIQLHREGKQQKAIVRAPIKSGDSIKSAGLTSKIDAKMPTEDDQKPKTHKSVGKPRQKAFISSLFTSNPEIPKIQSTTSKPFADISAYPSNGVSEDGLSRFDGLGIDSALSNHLYEKLGIKTPTAIQQKVIPYLIAPFSRTAGSPAQDGDVIVKAQTGSGKTLAFLLPIIHRLIRAEDNPDAELSRALGTMAVVVSPTRELAKQTYDVLESLLNYNVSQTGTSQKRSHWIVPGLVIGGDKRKAEKARLRKGVNVLVCTPGRILDHLKTSKSFSARYLRWIVLDEADRLMELGFEETLKEVFKLLSEKTLKPVELTSSMRQMTAVWPRGRQIILCSATMQTKVESFINDILRKPLLISESGDNSNQTIVPAQLQQYYVVVPTKLRLVALVARIREHVEGGNAKVIVFFSCCDAVEFYHALLANVNDGQDDSESGKESTPENCFAEPHSKYVFKDTAHLYKLHGNMPQSERHATYKSFAKNRHPCVLFCTDVAARGLDVKDVSHVVQYDPPFDASDYIHRIGRTARLGSHGSSTIFLLPHETEYVSILDQSMQTKISELSIESLLQNYAKSVVKAVIRKPEINKALRSGKTWRDPEVYQIIAMDAQMRFEWWVSSHAEIAQNAYNSHVRAYATHRAAEKHIFHVKQLHLGHLAKSFGMREFTQIKRKKAEKLKPRKKMRVSEFSSGL